MADMKLVGDDHLPPTAETLSVPIFATNVISLENLGDPIERMCKWWDPLHDDVQVCGRMYFRVGLESEIRLFDTCYEHRPDLFEHGAKTMVGITDQTEYVTAFNVMLERSNSSGNWNVEAQTSVASLTFVDAWMGQRKCGSKAEVRFESVFVALNGIIEWLGVKCTRASSLPGGRQESISFVAPDPVLLFENEEVAISIVVRSDKANQELAPIRYIGGIEIVSKNGEMPYYGETNSFEYWKNLCYGFLGTLIGRSVVDLDCVGAVSDGRPYGEHVELRHLWRRDVNPTALKKVNEDEVRYPYAMIKENLTACFTAYARLRQKVTEEVSHLVYLQTSSSSFSRSILPGLCFMFEGMQGELFKHENKFITADERLEVEAMVKSLGDGRDQAVRSRLKTHGEVHIIFSQRLRVVWNEIGSVYPYLKQGQVEALIKYIKDSRNAYAHCSMGFDYAEGFRLYMFAIFWMWTFMGAMVLTRCGLSVEVVLKCLSRLRCDYQETERNLRELLPDSLAAGGLTPLVE